MKVVKPVDVPRLFALWADHTLTRVDVAHRLGLSPTQLTRLVAQYRLPPRPRDRNQKTVDPTPEEIERDKAELKAKHLAERRAEPWCSTTSKVSKWRNGICEPGGGRHA